MKLAIHYAYNERVQFVECDTYEKSSVGIKLFRQDGMKPKVCVCSSSLKCDCARKTVPNFVSIGIVGRFEYIEVLP